MKMLIKDKIATIAETISPMKKAETLINDMEKNKTLFGYAERNLIVNLALHCSDFTKVNQLASFLADRQFEKNYGYVDPQAQDFAKNLLKQDTAKHNEPKKER